MDKGGLRTVLPIQSGWLLLWVHQLLPSRMTSPVTRSSGIFKKPKDPEFCVDFPIFKAWHLIIHLLIIKLFSIFNACMENVIGIQFLSPGLDELNLFILFILHPL